MQKEKCYQYCRHIWQTQSEAVSEINHLTLLSTLTVKAAPNILPPVRELLCKLCVTAGVWAVVIAGGRRLLMGRRD